MAERIVIVLEGGVVSGIFTNQPHDAVDLLVVDLDEDAIDRLHIHGETPIPLDQLPQDMQDAIHELERDDDGLVCSDCERLRTVDGGLCPKCKED